MKPIVRCILAIGTTALGIAPIAAALGTKEFTRTQAAAAESLLNSRLTTVAQDALNQSCYTTATLTKGSEVRLPDSVPASSCITDGDRYGFLGEINGHVRILEVFSAKSVASRKSDLLKTSK